MRKTLAATVGGLFFGTALYLLVDALLQVGPAALRAAAFIGCFAVGAFLTNLLFKRLGR